MLINYSLLKFTLILNSIFIDKFPLFWVGVKNLRLSCNAISMGALPQIYSYKFLTLVQKMDNLSMEMLFKRDVNLCHE